MQNYNFFGKKAIDYKEKLYLCIVFSEHESFYCSIILPNCDLERDLRANNTTLKLRTIAQTSSIVVLGLSQAWQDIWQGFALSLCPYR